MCVNVLLECMHVHSEEGVGLPGTGVTDSCELVCRQWKSKPGPLDEHQVLSTTAPHLISTICVCVCMCIYIHTYAFTCNICSVLLL